MHIGLWGIVALLLLATLALIGFMLGLFRLCDALTNVVHRLLGSKT